MLSGSSLFADGQILDQTINSFFTPATNFIFKIIFFKPFAGIPLVLIWLAGTAVFLTVYFKFINLTSLRLALRTITGRYSTPSDPGEITHFQALTAALSATVGLGNIAWSCDCHLCRRARGDLLDDRYRPDWHDHKIC